MMFSAKAGLNILTAKAVGCATTTNLSIYRFHCIWIVTDELIYKLFSCIFLELGLTNRRVTNS